MTAATGSPGCPTRLVVHPTPAAARAAVADRCATGAAIVGPAEIAFRDLETRWQTAALANGRLAAAPLEEVSRRLLAASVVAVRHGADAPGTWTRALVRLVNELARLDLDQGAFAERVDALPRSARDRLGPAKELYAAFRGAVRERNACDRLELNRGLLAAARAGLPAPWAGCREVLCVDSGRINPFRQALLLALGRSGACRVTVAPALEEHVVEALLRDRIEPELAKRFRFDSAQRATPFGSLVEALLQRSPELLDAAGLTDRIRLTRSVGLYGEVEDAARAIRRLLAGGVPAHEICLAMRRVDRYGQAVADVCGRFGIPFRFPRGIPPLLSPPVRATLALLETVRDGLPAVAVADVLDLAVLGAFPLPFDRRRQAARALRGWSQPELDRDSVERWQGAGRRADPDEIARREAAGASLSAFLEWAEGWSEPSAARPGDFADRLRDQLAGARTESARFDDSLRRDDAARVAGGFDLLRSVLESIRDADARVGTGEIGFGRFVELLRDELNEHTIAMPTDARGIAVANLADLPGRRFRHVFLLGLNEGVLPSPAPSTGLIPEEVRDLWNGESPGPTERLATRRGHQSEERILFLEAVQCATEGLHLYAQYHDGQVAELVPSVYFEDVADLVIKPTDAAFPGDPGASGGGAPPLADAAAADETTHRIFLAAGRSRRAVSSIDDDEIATATAAVGRLLGDDPSDRFPGVVRRAEIADYRETTATGPRGAQAAPHALGPWALDLRDTAAAGRISRTFERPLPATAVERLAQCPAAFFFTDILGLREREPPPDAIDPRDEGSLVHAFCRDYYDHLRSEGPTVREIELPGNDRRPAVDPRAIVDDQFERALEHVTGRIRDAIGRPHRRGGRPDLHAPSVGRIRALARTVLEFDRHCPVHRLVLDCEKPFGDEPGGDGDPWPALRIPREDGRDPFTIHGRIDRVEVEVDPEGRAVRIWVTDLKSAGSVDQGVPGLAHLESGVFAQLPVYTAVVAARFPDAGTANGIDIDGRLLAYGPESGTKRDRVRLGAILGKADTPITVREFVDPGPATDGSLRLASILRPLLERAVRGDFSTAPVACDDFCVFHGICGREPVAGASS